MKKALVVRHKGSVGRRALVGTGLLLLTLMLPAACAPGTDSEPGAEVEPAETLAESATETETAQAQAEPALHRFLPDEMRRSTRAETFPHEAHVQIDCAVCHASPPGHESHSELDCSDCHRASALSTTSAVAPEDCRACHHGPEQTFGCEQCHVAPAPLTTAQAWQLGVWDAPRSRTLEFEHGLHGDVACERCHADRPDLAPVPCATCHEEHHTVESRCASCHQAPAEGAHGPEVHLTCSGAGCHEAPDVDLISDTRAVCLACHVAQEAHEPGQECIECHQVRGGGNAGGATGGIGPLGSGVHR